MNVTTLKDIQGLPNDGVLLGYQRRWIADRADVKVAEKSRQVGLTWAESADDALLAASENGMDVFYISYNKDMTKEFIDDCAFWSRFYNLAASEVQEFVFKDKTPDGEKEIHAYRIDYDSGHVIMALSSRPSNLRSKHGKVVIDEAAFVDDLKGLLKAAMAFLIWGGKVVIISTHFGESNYFNILINDIRKGKYSYGLHTITLDDALADGLYKRICLILEKEWSLEAEKEWRDKLIKDYGEDADEELFCIPSQGSGIYFTSVVIESCMKKGIPVVRWICKDGFEQLSDDVRRKECQDWLDANVAPLLDSLDNDLDYYFGEDFARDRNLTIIFPGARQKNLSIKVPFSVELANVPFKQQEQILFFIVDRLPNFRGGAMDARGNGQYLAEVAMQKYGADRIFEIMLTREFYRDAMPKYKVRYEDKTIEIPQDADILDDHRAVRMSKGVPLISDTQRPGDKSIQRHGDSAVAGMLLCYAVDNGTSGPIEYETVKTRESMQGIGRGAW